MNESTVSIAWRPIFALILCVTAYSITLGLIYPFITLQLKYQGYGAGMIGLNGAMTPLGFILSSFFTPYLSRKIHPVTLIVLALISSAALLWAINLTTSFINWSMLRFLLGCTTSILFIVGETMLMKIAPAIHRGKIMGGYNSTITLGYGVGPTLLAGFGINNSAPFVIAVIIVLCTIIPILVNFSSFSQNRMSKRRSSSIYAFMIGTPFLAAGCAATALFDNAGMTLFPLFALSEGLAKETALHLLTALFIGGVVLQYPLGWVADRLNRVFLLAGCALATGIISILVLFITDNLVSYILVFLWGGAAFGVYTLVLALMSEWFHGDALLTGNVALAIAWGVGSFVGVPLTGGGIEVIGMNSYPLIIAVPFFILSLSLLISFRQHK